MFLGRPDPVHHLLRDILAVRPIFACAKSLAANYVKARSACEQQEICAFRAHTRFGMNRNAPAVVEQMPTRGVQPKGSVVPTMQRAQMIAHSKTIVNQGTALIVGGHQVIKQEVLERELNKLVTLASRVESLQMNQQNLAQPIYEMKWGKMVAHIGDFPQLHAFGGVAMLLASGAVPLIVSSEIFCSRKKLDACTMETFVKFDSKQGNTHSKSVKGLEVDDEWLRGRGTERYMKGSKRMLVRPHSRHTRVFFS